MKKVMLIAVLATAGLFATQSCEKNQTQINQIQEVSPELTGFPWVYLLTNLPPIKIDILFGERMPILNEGEIVGSQCYGGGICELHAEIGSNFVGDNNGQTTSGEMGYENGILYLRVKQSDLNSESINYLNSDYISVSDNIILESEIIQELGLLSSYKIESGLLQVAKSNGFVYVKLN